MINKTEFKETELGMIPKNWKIEKIDNLCNVLSSKRIFYNEYVNSGVPFYRSKEIIEKSNGNNISTELYITDEKFNEIKTKFGVPNEGDLLLTSVGTLGVPYVVKITDKFYFKDGNLTWFKDFNNLNSIFLYYWLISENGKNSLNQVAIGSTQKALTIRALKTLKLPIPPLQEQKAIAKILSDLDEKIEINRKINENLEELGQTLFKRWFIDFEFPNEQGEPYKSSGGEMVESELGEIPKGWKIGKVGELNKVQGGYAFKGQDFTEKGDVGIIKIKNISNKVVDIINTQFVNLDVIRNLDNKFKIQSGDILIAMTGAEVAKIGIIAQNNKLLYLNQRVGSFKEIVSKSKYYIYLLLTTEKYQALLRDTASGSAQPNISSSDIENIEIIVPTENLIIKFGIFFEDVYSKLIENLAEIQSLQQIRDSLLPKLMSGQIKKSEVNYINNKIFN